MKTTFKNLFNEWNDDLLNIPENTVCENTGISSQAIKNNALSQLGLHKMKKPFGKAFKLTVIAATLAVALIVGTTAIYADIGIEHIKEFFGGNMNAGLYDGGNVEVTTPDPNLNVELLAVTGDNNNFYAVIQAEKKDGGVFTDEEYIYDSHIGETDIYVSCRNQSGEYYTVFNSYSNKKYRLSPDRKILKIFISTDLTNGILKNSPDIVDGIVTVKNGTLKFHKIKEVFAVYDHIDVEIYENFIESVKEKNITDTWTWLETSEGVIFCTVDTKEYHIPFEITFSMKHDTDNNIHQSVSNESAPHFIKNSADNVQMDISSFGIRITADGKRLYDYDSESEIVWYLSDMCFERIKSENSKIILNDGKEYYFEVIPIKSHEDDDKSIHIELELNYTAIPNPTYTVDKTVIDTRKIRTIIINGDTVYSK